MGKILIIEDENDIAQLLKVNFSKQNWDIEIANDGYSAVKTILNNKPNLILLDLGLPYLEGDMVISLFNEKKLTNDIPVIIMSAKPEEEIKKAQQKIGAKTYIKKPIDFEKLIDLIKKNI